MIFLRNYAVILLFFLAISVPTQSNAQIFESDNVISISNIFVWDLITEDIDGDGDIDIIVSSVGDFELVWFENDGSGTFSEPQVISSTAPGLGRLSIVADDLDDDGDSDILHSRFTQPENNRIAWNENEGNAEFSPLQIISTEGLGSVGIDAADLDNDGDIDAIAYFYAPFANDMIVWLENDGMGVFSEMQLITEDLNGNITMDIADLDNDGDMDVLSSSDNDHKVAWYMNDGSGNFSEQLVISTDIFVPYSIHASDLDEDGYVDVLYRSSFDSTLVWHKNEGLGVFGPPQSIVEARMIGNIITADIDGDGDKDIVSSDNGKIAWFLNDGSEQFSEPQLISTEDILWNAQSLADLDGDGDLDLVSSSMFSSLLVYHENNGLSNGVDELPTTTTLLFPNPIIENAVIQVGEIRGLGQISIYNAIGQLVSQKQSHIASNEIIIQRDGLVSGLYQLIIQVHKHRISVSFVVE